MQHSGESAHIGPGSVFELLIPVVHDAALPAVVRSISGGEGDMKEAFGLLGGGFDMVRHLEDGVDEEILTELGSAQLRITVGGGTNHGDAIVSSEEERESNNGEQEQGRTTHMGKRAERGKGRGGRRVFGVGENDGKLRIGNG